MKAKKFFIGEGWNKHTAKDMDKIYRKHSNIESCLWAVSHHCIEEENDEQHDYRLELIPLMARLFVINEYYGDHLDED